MDQYYSYPEQRIREIKEAKPWCEDPKYFKKVKISPSACIKMLTHGQSGVEKGIAQSGKPVEVMGLLLGRPDTVDLNAMLITDAIPVPGEGFETRVVVDDENVIQYMIDMGESIELTRSERFCGWYHTHPFDLDGTSHCYLSNTDVTTQLSWQRSEDKHGNHWLAIVIDPLLSVEQNKPEMMAFRVYPPEYAPPKDETPDGKIIREERLRVEKWGNCWNRYYKLEIEYFMSNLAQETLGIMRNKFLWPKAFINTEHQSSESLKSDYVTMNAIAARLENSSYRRGVNKTSDNRQDELSDEDIGSIDRLDRNRDVKGLHRSSELACDIARHHSCAICNILVKKAIFCMESNSATLSSTTPAKIKATNQAVNMDEST